MRRCAPRSLVGDAKNREFRPGPEKKCAAPRSFARRYTEGPSVYSPCSPLGISGRGVVKGTVDYRVRGSSSGRFVLCTGWGGVLQRVLPEAAVPDSRVAS